MSPEFLKAASVCMISDKDHVVLGASEGNKVKVSSTYGETVLSMVIDSGLPAGMIFVPIGPWANAIIGPDTAGCGTPQFKGIEVDVRPTDQPILTVREMFEGMARA